MGKRNMANNTGKTIKNFFWISYFCMAIIYALSLTLSYVSGTYSFISQKDAIYELLSRDARTSSNNRSHVEYHRTGSFTWNDLSNFYIRSSTQTHSLKTYTYLATYALTSKNDSEERFDINLDDSVFNSNSITLPYVAYFNDKLEPDDERYLMFNSIDLYRYKHIENDWKNVTINDGYSFIYLSYSLADEILAAKGYSSYDQLIGKDVIIKNGSSLNKTLTVVNIIVNKGSAKQIVDLTGNFFISYNPDIIRSGYTRFCSEFRSSVINIRDYFSYCYLNTWQNGDYIKSIKMINGDPVKNNEIDAINFLIAQTIDGENYSNEFLFYLFFFLSLLLYCVTLFIIVLIMIVGYEGQRIGSSKLLRLYAYSVVPFVLTNAILCLLTGSLSSSLSYILFFNFFGSKFSVISALLILLVLMVFNSINNFLIDCINREKESQIRYECIII